MKKDIEKEKGLNSQSPITESLDFREKRGKKADSGFRLTRGGMIRRRSGKRSVLK